MISEILVFEVSDIKVSPVLFINFLSWREAFKYNFVESFAYSYASNQYLIPSWNNELSVIKIYKNESLL